MALSKDDITVWGVGTTRTFRVHWILHELGIEYLTRSIQSRTGETRDAEYTRLNPKQKIPTLVHDDFSLSESHAILRYARTLSDELPYDDYQQSPRGKARYDEWCSFILMELDATSLYVVRRHKDLPEIYGEAPAAVDSCIEYFSKSLNAVSSQIEPAKPVWGSTFSEVDVLMTVALDWATFLDIDLPQHIAAYRDNMRSRPAYQQAFRHNFQNLSGNPA